MAQEILITCVKNNWSAFFLKLDFAKAFDTLKWAFLLKVLHACGFDVRWCGWIQFLNSEFSLVLINSQPEAPY